MKKDVDAIALVRLEQVEAGHQVAVNGHVGGQEHDQQHVVDTGAGDE